MDLHFTVVKQQMTDVRESAVTLCECELLEGQDEQDNPLLCFVL